MLTICNAGKASQPESCRRGNSSNGCFLPRRRSGCARGRLVTGAPGLQRVPLSTIAKSKEKRPQICKCHSAFALLMALLRASVGSLVTANCGPRRVSRADDQNGESCPTFPVEKPRSRRINGVTCRTRLLITFVSQECRSDCPCRRICAPPHPIDEDNAADKHLHCATADSLGDGSGPCFILNRRWLTGLTSPYCLRL